MPVHRVSQPMLAFRWNRRKEACTWVLPPGYGTPPATVTRVVEDVRDIQDEEQIRSTIAELSKRQYECFKQLLIEAKFKAEAMIRDDTVAGDPGRMAYYAGWISYADYVITSFEMFRTPEAAPQESP